MRGLGGEPGISWGRGGGGEGMPTGGVFFFFKGKKGLLGAAKKGKDGWTTVFWPGRAGKAPSVEGELSRGPDFFFFAPDAGGRTILWLR